MRLRFWFLAVSVFHVQTLEQTCFIVHGVSSCICASGVPSQEASRGRTVKRATQTANGQDDGLLAEAYGEMTRL